MRTKNAIKNIGTSLITGMLLVIVGFAVQKSIVHSLGLEYAGINSLFISIISMLAIAEMGFGQALIYHMYEPVKRENWDRINVLMRFYRKSYMVIAGVVVVSGLLLLPFLGAIVGDVNHVNSNIYIIFILFIVNAVASYLLAYKKSLLYAHQKTYVVDNIHTTITLSVNIIQIILLVLTQNYYLYLIGNIVATVSENIFIWLYTAKKYPEYSSHEKNNLDEPTRKHIFKQLRGLLFHKSAGIIIPGSGNVILSVLLGIKAVGLASSYLLLSTAITSMVWKLLSSITASIGNLLVDADAHKKYEVYQRLQFGTAYLATITASLFFVAANKFVGLWLGQQYVLSMGAVLALTVYIYFFIMRIAPHGFKQAAGIFHEDRHVPLLEAGINIAIAYVGVLVLGIDGIFWGLALSTVFLHVYAYPKYTYGLVIGQRPFLYILDIMPYAAFAVLSCISTMLIVNLTQLEGWWGLVLLVFSIFVLINTLWLIIFWRKHQMRYYTALLGSRERFSR